MTAHAEITIATTVVDDRGNLADASTGFGAVAYAYRIGTSEVTNTQYAAFLTAKAAVTDTRNLYNTGMGGQYGGIIRTENSGSYTYAVKSGFANKPVNYVSFWDATRFTNWLNNGQGTGSTETGGYTLTEAVILGNTVTRNAGANWVVPTESEWYKAAYYDPNKGGLGVGGYWQRATKSDTLGDNTANVATNGANYFDGSYANGGLSGPGTTDVGSYSSAASNYGTFDQAGNVSEWNEQDTVGGSRGLRGGSWADGDGEGTLLSSLWGGGDLAPTESFGAGFRVASVVANPAMLNLGRAQGFAALAGIGITNSANSIIAGTGGHRFGIATDGPFVGHGAILNLGEDEKLVNVPAAQNAMTDALAAWNAGKKATLDGLLPGALVPTTVTFGGLGRGTPYTRGIYTQGTAGVKGIGAFTIDSHMTLDGQGDPNSVFIFQSEAALTTAAFVNVILINGAQSDHVFWILGAAFTTGASSSFSGTVIAAASLSFGAATLFSGQAFGLTFSTLTIGDGVIMTHNSPIPEPSRYGAAMGAVGLGVVMMRRRKSSGSRRRG